MEYGYDPFNFWMLAHPPTPSTGVPSRTTDQLSPGPNPVSFQMTRFLAT